MRQTIHAKNTPKLCQKGPKHAPNMCLNYFKNAPKRTNNWFRIIKEYPKINQKCTPLRSTHQWRLWGWEGFGGGGGIYRSCARVDHLPLSSARSCGVYGVGKGLVRGEVDLQGLRSCRSFTPLKRTQQWEWFDYSKNVPKMCLKCSKTEPNMYCAKNVPKLCQKCTNNVPKMCQ